MAAVDKPGLQWALERGEPLADFTIAFAAGRNYADLTERLNRVGDDLFVHERPWYDVPNLRLAVGTKAALEREFGWVLRRAPCPAGGFWWEVVVEPQHSPAGLEGSIVSMGLSQPGADDNGQPYEWP
jgi:hypothetical protein